VTKLRGNVNPTLLEELPNLETIVEGKVLSKDQV